MTPHELEKQILWEQPIRWTLSDQLCEQLEWQLYKHLYQRIDQRIYWQLYWPFYPHRRHAALQILYPLHRKLKKLQ